MSASSPNYLVNGWIILNKPPGISSAKAVAKVKHCFGGVKIGHAGTLDPLASGVLPMALGEATKTISYVMLAEKSYYFSVNWGAETQTDDCEGEITSTSETIPNRDEIISILPRFTGLIEQVPPDYSAVKIKGNRAYALARSRDRAPILDKSPRIELAARQVRIDRLTLLGTDNHSAHFEVYCGKGTYIRSLARDMGRALASAAHVNKLERRSVGKFHIDNTISLDLLESLGYDALVFDHVMPIMTALDDIPALAITQEEENRLRFGQTLMLDADRQVRFDTDMSADGIIKAQPYMAMAVCRGNPVALVRSEAGIVFPVKVLNM